MLAQELIDRLERRGLLDQEIIEALREQMSQSGARVTPEAIAKLLVDNGQLTRFQATKLIGELRSDDPDDDVVEAVAIDDELTAIDDEGDPLADDLPEAEPIVDDEPVEAIPVAVAVMDEPETAPSPRPRPTRIARPPEKSTWDSFKVYGYLGIIGALLLISGALTWYLNKASADDVIEVANKLYNDRSFQPAQDAYAAFLSQFGQKNQYSSLARTRIRMAELYRAEAMTDPVAGLDLAKEKLPDLINEEGLNQERGNLAQLLVDIAENLANSAGKAKETAEKQRLLEKLDEQQTLIDNPNYMLSSTKETLSAKLLEISETRSRVLRDIKRNLRLDETVAAMTKLLDEQQTKPAYDLRRKLLREFPELRDDSSLVELIAKASGIQAKLVAPSTKLPELTTDPVGEQSLRTIVLTSVEGETIPGMEDEIYYLRAGGSVLAFSIGDGRLLWRKFTGYGQDHTPIRLDRGAAVLLSDIASNEVRRCQGDNGELQWRCQIEETFPEPVAGRELILVSGASGRLIALDQKSGALRWAAQFPQTISSSAGLDDSLERIYLPGDHSNLYVLNSRDGQCIESYYVGHAEGTIKVPPVSLLGHLFVVENAGADYARVHVLRLNDKGDGLTVAQPPFRLTGNVFVPPVVEDRRLIVLTDRGQVAVYDVEPTAEREQVSLIAQQPASYDQPTMTRMAVGRSQVWITGNRVGRFELQINTGRVVYDWGKFEGDSFVGQPLALGDVLVHARQLRDTSSIRVTAAVPKTGDPLWSTDVGTPIAAIYPVTVNGRPGGKTGGFHVITSQASLYELDAQSLAEGSTKAPIENPGKLGISMRFADPVTIDANRSVMLNQISRDQAIIYDPTRRSEQLRKVTLSVTDSQPTGPAIYSGGGLLLPLQSGRVVLLDWQTGSPKGAPFQPATDPTKTVTWNRPVALADDADQVVIADSRKKLYRLRVGDQIRELSSIDLKKPFLAMTAGVGGQYIGAVAGPSADLLVGYDLASLKESFQTTLDGRVVWGPIAVSSDSGAPAGSPSDPDASLLMTDDRVLRCFDASGKQRFELALPLAGTLLDEIVAVEGNWVLTSREGWLMAVDPQSGKLRGTIELGQPLSARPLPVGGRLLVPGAEGVIYITEIPGAK